ncbi:MAG: hypothetical protein JNM90_23995 [Burkholderiales bacterium]|nr:hypothetical protein [Burkholderiales bacterium]
MAARTVPPRAGLAVFLACTAVAAWLAWPSRNVHGNPGLETLRASCRTTGKVTARLYEGNGGATTSYWYTVTLEGDALGRERQVFFAYAFPQVVGIDCAGDAVIVRGDTLSRRIEPAAFSTLRETPMQFWSGKETTIASQPRASLTVVAAAVTALGGLAVLLKTRVNRADRNRNAG